MRTRANNAARQSQQITFDIVRRPYGAGNKAESVAKHQPYHRFPDASAGYQSSNPQPRFVTMQVAITITQARWHRFSR